jgi:hypothetical protein
MPGLRIVLAASLVFLLAACGASQQGAGEGDDLYPVVTDPPPEHGETVTVGGAMISKPVKPSEYESEPSPSCERQPYKSASGGGLLIVPPRPGLSAKAVSERSVEVSWWFEEVPDDCRPVSVLVSIVANDAPSATPTTVTVPYSGKNGTTTVDYPEFLPPPDVALTSGVMARGQRSRTARVLIRR